MFQARTQKFDASPAKHLGEEELAGLASASAAIANKCAFLAVLPAKRRRESCFSEGFSHPECLSD